VSADAETALVRMLAARGGALVILDNVEHLLPDAATTVRRWVTAAPEVRFLVTSRAPLEIAMERVVELGGVTGSDAIDAYFTCGAMEPADSAAHYAEVPVALPGIGVDYPMPAEPEPASRADFALPEAKRLYACPQSLFKIHPEMDALLAGVLARDPEAVLVLFQAPARAVTQLFAARLQRAMSQAGIAPRGQVKFLPRIDAASFRRVLSLCDVVLDTVRWSGGNTSLDAFAATTPVVALPGRFMRGRQTAAMLGLMELDSLVATGPEDYVARALDAARRPELRDAIRKARGALFARPEPVSDLADALLAWGSGSVRRPPPAVY
jgi:CRISPR-associated protein Csy1